MSRHRFYQLDVFTDRPLTGNPLAVFPDARGLRAATMQALAREMNLSETSFVLPSEEADRRVRFFTPTSELPLAGHPTIGTWWVLAHLDVLGLPADGNHTVRQETGAGILAVEIRLAGGAPDSVVMTQAPPTFGPVLDDHRALGAALGGDGETIADAPPPQIVSTGLPQAMIPIRSLAALQRLPGGGSGAALAALLRRYGSDCAMCYTLETEARDATVHCRMFAPGLGVPEDPATGSASGALGAYLVHHELVPLRGRTATVVVEQGAEMGRPSRIRVEVETNGDDPSTVRVGGRAVVVIEGEVRL